MGEQQRLAFARAVLQRPDFLFMDEATSALDAETETAIIRTLDELEGDVTTVTVAHRLATVRRADQLLYLKDGRVLHHQTMAAKGSSENPLTPAEETEKALDLIVPILGAKRSKTLLDQLWNFDRITNVRSLRKLYSV